MDHFCYCKLIPQALALNVPEGFFVSPSYPSCKKKDSNKLQFVFSDEFVNLSGTLRVKV